MSTPTFVWLGSKRSRKHDVAPKGRLLDVAAGRGLPAPNGAILLDELYRLLLDEGVIRRQGRRIVVPAPMWLYETIYDSARLPRLARPCAIRAAFSAEDHPFPARLNVNVSDPAQLAEALRAVWSAGLALPDAARRDVLIMEMVTAQTTGVAFAEEAYQDDLVTVAPAPTGDDEKTISLPRLQPLERPSSSLPPFARRLQQLLRGVRRTFGQGEWKVSWADDGRVCWLLGVTPLSDAPPRNDVFTLLAPAETSSNPPISQKRESTKDELRRMNFLHASLRTSPLISGIVSAAADELFAYFHQFDSGLAAGRPLIELFAGRPFLNLTLLGDVMRAWGLPPHLIGETPNRVASFRLGRALRHSFPLLKFGWAQLTAVSRVQNSVAAMRTRTQTPGETYGDVIETLLWLYARLGRETLNLNIALNTSQLLVRRDGLLARPARRRRQRIRRAWPAWEEEVLRCRRRMEQRVEELGETAVAQGQLPAAAAIWLLHPEEVRALDGEAVYEGAFLAQRKAEWEAANEYALPKRIRRFAALEQYQK